MDQVANLGIKTKPKFFKRILKHKFLIIIIIIAVLGGSFLFYKNKNSSKAETLYVLGNVGKGSVVTTVSGTGQVSSLNQVDIKPKIATDKEGTTNILSLNVKTGQVVKEGDILAKIDSKNLELQLKNAKNSLDVAKNSLALKLAGLTKEELEITKKSVESSKLSYETTVKNLATTEKNSAENLRKAQLTLTNAEINLTNAERDYNNAVSSASINTDSNSQENQSVYNNAKNNLNSSYTNLRSAIVVADNILGMNNYSSSSTSYKNYLGARDSQSINTAQDSYYKAKKDLESFESIYKGKTNFTNDEIEALSNSIVTSLQSMKDLENNVYTVLINTITSTDMPQNVLDGFKSSVSSQESSLASSISNMQTNVKNINNIKLNLSSLNISTSSSVSNAKASLEKAKNSLTDAKASLEQTKVDNEKSLDNAKSDIASKKLAYESSQAQLASKTAKPRDIDLVSLRVQISQAENNYEQAQDDLKNAEVVAPFDGIVAKVYQSVGDAASPSTAILTLVTSKKLATIDLNEVDTAKLSVGQKTNLTFNAIENLNISGEIAEIDSIGTVNQGVVNYSVKIAFDTQDDRVKPQMSVSAVITTSEKFDVLTVPSSAIKTENELSYVEAFNEVVKNPAASGVTSSSLPIKKYIVTGDSDGSVTEITSGLSEGDQIIIKTTTNSKTSTSSSTSSSRSGMGMIGGAMGGGPR